MFGYSKYSSYSLITLLDATKTRNLFELPDFIYEALYEGKLIMTVIGPHKAIFFKTKMQTIAELFYIL